MASRFDRVAMTMAGGFSRRTALGWFSAIVPAFLVAGADEGTAFGGQNMDVDNSCSKFCHDVLPHQRGQCESACKTCSGTVTNLCGKPGTFTCCSSGTVCCYSVDNCGKAVSVCTDTSSDPQNCGKCGTVCTGGTCVNGKCVTSCPPSQTLCGSLCTTTSNDSMNCGKCGNACDPGQLCVSGVCECASGMTLCSATGGLYACTNTQTDNNNCGACSTVCATSMICVNGTCTGVCPAGQVICGSTCTSTATDPNNCGACGYACEAGQTCSAGKCTGCATGQVMCGSTCTSTATDSNNCGTCGNMCPAGSPNCCESICTNFMTDHNNCGGCGPVFACPPVLVGVVIVPGVCIEGVCGV